MRVSVAAAALVLLVSPHAFAGGTQVVASAPLLLGVDQHAGADSDTNFAIGVRPEVVYVPPLGDARWGIGVYGDAIASHGGVSWLGGGATGVLYLPSSLAVAVSGGADERFASSTSRTTPVFGAFFGLRDAHTEITDDGWPLELPFGVRADIRPGSAETPTSITVQAQLDVPGLVAFFVFLSQHPEFGH